MEGERSGQLSNFVERTVHSSIWRFNYARSDGNDYKKACGLNWAGSMFLASSWIVFSPTIFWSEPGNETEGKNIWNMWAFSSYWSKGIRGCNEPMCGLRKVALMQMSTEFPGDKHVGQFLYGSRKRGFDSQWLIPSVYSDPRMDFF